MRYLLAVLLFTIPAQYVVAKGTVTAGTPAVRAADANHIADSNHAAAQKRAFEEAAKMPAQDEATAQGDAQMANPNADPNAAVAGELQGEQVLPTMVAAIGALQTRDFAMLTALLIMLLVFAVDMLWLRRQPDDKRAALLPWMSVIMGVAVQFAATLSSTHSWLEALNMALITGTSASGLWSLVGKQVVGRLAPKDAAANPARQVTSVPPPEVSVVHPDIPAAVPPPAVSTQPPPPAAKA